MARLFRHGYEPSVGMQTKSVLSQWRKEEKKLQSARIARKKQAKQLCCQLFWPMLSKVHYFSFTIGPCSVRNVQFATKDVPNVLVNANNKTFARFVRVLEAAHSMLFVGLTNERDDPSHILRISVGRGRVMLSLSNTGNYEADKAHHITTMAKPYAPRAVLRPKHF